MTSQPYGRKNGGLGARQDEEERVGQIAPAFQRNVRNQK